MCLGYRGFPFDRKAFADRAGADTGGAPEDLLAAAYRLSGAEFPWDLAGPCAFVVWDGRREELFARSDPSGYFPLFVAESGRQISIATRVEALIDRTFDRLNRATIAAHVCSLSARPSETFFRDVRKIDPGSSLKVGRREAVERPSPPGLPEPRPADEESASAVVRQALLRVVPDYAPEGEILGVTVSSGLDSTAVAAALRAARPDARIVGFVWTARSVPSADESGPARRAAERLGLEIVEIAADRHGPLDDPRGIDPGPGSPLYNVYSPTWRETFRAARKLGIRTILTGHAGDFAFGSIFPFADLFLTGRWLRLAREIRAYRRRVDVNVPWLIRYRVLGRAARWLVPAGRPAAPSWLGPALRDELLRLPRAAHVDRLALPGDRDRRQMLTSSRRFAATAALADEGAELGVDLRFPWIDPRIAALARSIPAAWTFSDGFSKVLVRRAMRGLLPDEILDRPEKIYPTELLVRALAGHGRTEVDALCSDMVAADLGFVEPKALRRAVEECAGGQWRGAMFWQSLTLEAWLRGMSR